MSASRDSEKPETRLRRRAMDLLARREHAYAELLQKLTLRFPDEEPELISAVVDRLRDQNLQSDERFLESYLNTRQSAGMGPLRIRMELQQKGVNAFEAEQALNACPEEEWYEQAADALQRRFPCPPVTIKDRQKAWRFLQQRGFEPGMIGKVLKNADSDNS